jgi:hypothetical protein
VRLDGSLEDFTLPDILQLLTRTQKTGSLQLHAAGDERRGLVRLAAGAVNGASSDLRRHALARRLVGAGLISDEALTAAAGDARAGAPSLVRALLERDDVATDELHRLATDQVTDAVCELLRWSTGTFSFLVGDPDPEGLELGLDVEKLLAEGERRMQVWPSLTTHIPSGDAVLRLAASPAFDPSCSREEWGLIALVDGSRSVNEIVALLGRSEFIVAGALSALVERGLLTISTPGSGLGDLQRRQDVIAALEGVPQATQPQQQPEPEPEPAPPAEAPAFEVPMARNEASPTGSADPLTYDLPMTEGSVALAPSFDAAAGLDESARGLDSAVTKSLVLRLIAGVRGL